MTALIALLAAVALLSHPTFSIVLPLETESLIFQVSDDDGPDIDTSDDCVEVDARIALVKNAADNIGALYTRWGRGSCQEGRSLVYSGFMGGSFYSHTGGAAEYLCLPDDPEYGNFTDGDQSGATLHSAELQTENTFEPFTTADQGTPTCAVCFVSRKTMQVMIPARTSCPDKWTEEYKGYLMAAHHNARRTKHVCIDKDVEIVPGTKDNKNGALLYFTEASKATDIPHPPYDEDKELTCVVCSR